MNEPTVISKMLLIGKDCLKDKYGKEKLKKYLFSLDEKTKSIWEQPRVSVSKLKASEIITIVDSIVKFYWQGNYNMYESMVSDMFEYELSGPIKIFLKIVSPTMIIHQLPRIYNHYNNKGEIKIIKNEFNSFEMEAINQKEYGRQQCWSTIGIIKSALKFCGCKNIKVSHSDCLFEGGSKCIFVGKYN